MKTLRQKLINELDLRGFSPHTKRSYVDTGTSSWKYPGWAGMLYDEQRYLKRGKFSEKMLEENCLAEYAQVFKTVSVDASYYKFPTESYLRGLVADVPDDFQFGLKVTEEIMIKQFANLPKHGKRAGTPNPNFLNADLFARAFLKPCEPFRQNLGLLMFEFSRFHPSDYGQVEEFVADLDRFLDTLPKGWPYAVELRTEKWFKPTYFNCLARHGVTHVFNSWEAAPPISEQLAMAGSETNPALTAARFLLKPGRKYQQAVDMFQPYARVQEKYEDARAAGKKLIARGKAAAGKKKTFIYVNNRLEGNALETIAAMLDLPDTGPSKHGQLLVL